MSPTYSQHFDTDFCATVHVVPFDPEADRQREVEEIIAIWDYYERKHRYDAAKGCLIAMLSVVLFWAGILAWCGA
jgi:hypothetical protein